MKSRIAKTLPFLTLSMAVLLTGCANGAKAPSQSAASETADTTLAQAADPTAAATAEPAQSVTALPSVHTFSASTVNDTQFTQEDIAAADVTVINIWQTTCGPCIVEMPELAELQASLPEHVQLVTWCLDAENDPELTAQILEQSGFEGVTLTQADGDLLNMVYQVMYTPTTVFLDSEGNHIIPEMIGSPEDPVEAYRDSINTALRTLGKEELPT